MASQTRGRYWKKPSMTYESKEVLDSEDPNRETAVLDSGTEEEAWNKDPQDQGSLEGSSRLDKRPSEEEGDKQLDQEREEEQTFLVNLYNFMKERNTPIERVPHLGFKQINLWRIYQAVEKLGGYELVTGRRLWKNVYDELGGSPGSTSAATCTRRHYERLVLPYVWNTKGEHGKPPPPAKPRKRYRLDEEKGEKTRDKNGKRRKERNCEQIPVEKEKHESIVAAKEENQKSNQQTGFRDRNRPHSQSDSQDPGEAQCCSTPPQRLVSSLFSHGIMSPLAKKKLLAQASKARVLCHCKKHSSLCPGEQSAPVKEELPDSSRPSTNLQAKSPSAEEHLKNVAPASLTSSVGGGGCTGKDPQNSSDKLCGSHSPTSSAFTGSFHAYRSDFYRPFGCNPLRDLGWCVPASRGFTELSVFPTSRKDLHHDPLMKQPKKREPQEQPAVSCSQASRPLGSWSLSPACPSGGKPDSPFLNVKACWVPPMTHLTRVHPKPSPQPSSPSARKANTVQPVFQTYAFSPASARKRCLEEIEATCRKNVRAASPCLKEMELKDKSDSGVSKLTQPLVNKPKPLVPGSTFPVMLTPSTLPQDIYKERTMLNYPTYFSHIATTLKSPSPQLPSLPFSPFTFPPFSGHLLPAAAQSPNHTRPLATTLMPYPIVHNSSLRQRMYPVPTWQVQPACTPLHKPVPQLNTNL
ncbi:AT-rich interactive domain-containing protein 5A-like isoform X1 [Rhinatrema bivittatum]|uniref:AT-rich interactive domain-containing protein 5A-like isoform X1 n=1 Tax=Rhinatrema bivittatum TaxID=194408 RepID=UPI00112BD13E|nr:AT-rich interactive domain-containing protein 5A-like isoform X1 [Rhinatrema bivittatum]